MKILMVLLAFYASNLFASEVVVKSSVPFSFPTTVGVAWKVSSAGKDLSFVSKTRSVGRKTVEFSWSVPGTVENGFISVFNVRGVKVKSFSLASREGTVQWDVSTDKRIGNGIYFAKLVCGAYKKNIKIAIY
jgi:flagellar hook assembly protein FlgD